MLKVAAFIFALFFIVSGLAGFSESIAPNGMLFGLFHVNAAHNLVHLLSGVAALICGSMGEGPARAYFKIFGLVYAAVAFIGFFYRDQPILGIIAHNTMDIWLHIGIAAVSLFLGFAAGASRSTSVSSGSQNS